MSKTTSCQRSLALLRHRGHVVEEAEQRLSFKGFLTRDPMGCIALAAGREDEIVGVHTPSRNNQDPRSPRDTREVISDPAMAMSHRILKPTSRCCHPSRTSTVVSGEA